MLRAEAITGGAMTGHLHPISRLTIPFAVLCLLVASMAGCGDDESASTSTTGETTTTEAATTTATSEPDAGIDEGVVAVATALCEAYDGIQEPGAIDELLALMTDDVVVTDTVLGASLTGHEQVRGYLMSDAFAGVDTMTCGASVQRGGWVAGTYTLGNSTTGQAGQGIAAIHVVDGKVDQQVNYYTPVDTGAVPPPTEATSESVILDYCHAWDDGVDADAVLSYLAPDAELVVLAPIVGLDAIRAFVENDFDFDQNDCDGVAVVHGSWGAAANTFTNTSSGASVQGINIIRFDDEGRIVGHYVHVDLES
jgi:ketosteroid isomerase-like protein